jgi:hypothetical protein
MLAEYTVGDTAPDLIFDLYSGGGSRNLTGVLAVLLFLRKPSGSAVTRTMTISDTPTSGRVSYRPQPADFDESGDFHCDVRVTSSDGTFQHGLRPFLIRVRAEGESY